MLAYAPRNGKSAGAGGSAPQPLPSSPRAAARRQSTKGGREEDGSDYEEEEEVEVEEDEAAGEAAGAPEKTGTDGFQATPHGVLASLEASKARPGRRDRRCVRADRL